MIADKERDTGRAAKTTRLLGKKFIWRLLWKVDYCVSERSQNLGKASGIYSAKSKLDI